MNPDEIPLWFAIPASIVLCILWRRQVVLERRAHCSITVAAFARELAHRSGELESGG